jgi:hypothetical protein
MKCCRRDRISTTSSGELSAADLVHADYHEIGIELR